MIFKDIDELNDDNLFVLYEDIITSYTEYQLGWCGTGRNTRYGAICWYIYGDGRTDPNGCCKRYGLYGYYGTGGDCHVYSICSFCRGTDEANIGC